MSSSGSEEDYNGLPENFKYEDTECMKEIENLTISKKRAEKKYLTLKKHYEKELSSFKDLKVDDIFKNSGAKDYIEKTKKLIATKDKTIKTLKEELDRVEAKCSELEDKYADSEKRCNSQSKALKDARAKIDKLEAEKRDMSQSSWNLNMSPPPPPEIEVPSVEEILRARPNTTDIGNFDMVIPPPPPVDVPFEEIFRNCGRNQ